MMHRISSPRCRLRFINILLDVTKTTTTIMTEMMIEIAKHKKAAPILTRLLQGQHGFSSDSGIGWENGKIRELAKMFLGFLVLLGFTSSGDGAGVWKVSRKFFKLGCTS